MEERKTKAWKILFSRIDSHEKALQAAREAAKGFFLVAAVQGGIGLFLTPAMLLDAALFAVFAGVLLKWKSRTAALLLLVLSAMSFLVTILNRMGIMAEGGTNIILATLVLWISLRAVEAAFKLQGKFKKPTQRRGDMGDAALSLLIGTCSCHCPCLSVRILLAFSPPLD